MATTHLDLTTTITNCIKRNYKTSLIRLFEAVRCGHSVLVVCVSVCLLQEAVPVGQETVAVGVSVCVAVCRCVAVCVLLFLAVFDLALVGVFVELCEEEPEEDCVETNPVHEASRVVAGDEEELESVGEDHHKLNLKRILGHKDIKNKHFEMPNGKPRHTQIS